MEEFESAKASFSQGLKLRQEQQSNRDTAAYARYIRKCNAEMAGMVFCSTLHIRNYPLI